MFCCVSKVTSRPAQHPVLRVCLTFLVGLFLRKSWLHVCNHSNRFPDCLPHHPLRNLTPVKVHCSLLALHRLLLLIRRWQTSCRLFKIATAVSVSSKLRRPSNRHSSNNKLMRLRGRVRTHVTCMQCNRHSNKLLGKNQCQCGQ